LSLNFRELESDSDPCPHDGYPCSDAEKFFVDSEAQFNLGTGPHIETRVRHDVTAEFSDIGDFAAKQESAGGDNNLSHAFAREASTYAALKYGGRRGPYCRLLFSSGLLCHIPNLKAPRICP